ncbi:uncharacterized protein LOC142974874 [Anticarsia gemmatalis]|uniref:uncharacterized protein LOC142974874 n=1 Tax=Anticarsia gemmatalis TaxID=129554 RepID=UPI003F760FF9
MSSQHLIANELLAFIQHAIGTMDDVSIVQICKSSFKEKEINSGKKILFQTLEKLDSMPSRKRDGNNTSIQDIITLLKGTDPHDVPAFVAKDLHKLPPVIFNHVDVTSLSKDIIFLKTSMAEMQSKLTVADNTLCELLGQVALLRNTISFGISMSPDAANVNAQRVAQNVSISSFDSVNSCMPPEVKTADVASSPAPRTIPPVPPTVVATREDSSSPKHVYAANTASTSTQKKREQKSNIAAAQSDLSWRSAKTSCDTDGFIKVEKKKKKSSRRNRCSTAPTARNPSQQRCCTCPGSIPLQRSKKL